MISSVLVEAVVLAILNMEDLYYHFFALHVALPQNFQHTINLSIEMVSLYNLRKEGCCKSRF